MTVKSEQNTELKQQSTELIERFKIESEGKAYMVDRRIINSFLVQYANPKTDHAVKKSMLEAMSKVLVFSESERVELGMVECERPKMRESLMNFLMGGDEL